MLATLILIGMLGPSAPPDDTGIQKAATIVESVPSPNEIFNEYVSRLGKIEPVLRGADHLIAELFRMPPAVQKRAEMAYLDRCERAGKAKGASISGERGSPLINGTLQRPLDAGRLEVIATAAGRTPARELAPTGSESFRFLVLDRRGRLELSRQATQSGVFMPAILDNPWDCSRARARIEAGCYLPSSAEGELRSGKSWTAQNDS